MDSQSGQLVQCRQSVLGLQALNIELQKSLVSTLLEQGVLDQGQDIATLVRNLQRI